MTAGDMVGTEDTRVSFFVGLAIVSKSDDQ